MTRHELELLVWRRLREFDGQVFSQKLVSRIIRTAFEIIGECMTRGELVRIERFGNFKPRAYPSKKSWSHTKKKLIDSRPYMRVDFIMSRALKRIAKDLLVSKGGPDG